MLEYSAILGDYILGKKLGEGKFSKVRIGTKAGVDYAVKYMVKRSDDIKNTFITLALNETKIILQLDHPNIVKLYEYSERGTIVKKSGKEIPVIYLVLELINGGELFDYIAVSGPFNDGLARYYFKQLFAALEYMHSKGYVHRDIKAENILVDDKCNLKLVDFGFATANEGPKKDGKLHSRKGTTTYMAPELHVGFPYSGEKVDLFAAGILLFTMIAQHPPFRKAGTEDLFYKHFCQNNNTYWDKISINKPAGIFSNSFKEFINGILELNPLKRFTMADVKAHPWFNEPTPSLEEVQTEIISRRMKIENSWKESAEYAALNKNDIEMTKIGAVGGSGFSLGTKTDTHLINILYKTTRSLKEYKPLIHEQTILFSINHPEKILNELTSSIEQQDGKIIFKTETFKGMCTYTNVEGGDNIIKIKIERVDGNTNCIRFQKAKGSKFTFLELYNELKEDLIEKGIILETE